MKRIISTILTAVILLSGTACSNTMQNHIVSFYYCKSELNFEPNSQIIEPEERQITYAPNDYSNIMRIYFEGPQNKGLSSPFPNGLKLVDIILEDSVANVIFSDELSQLTGIDLTLACMCIANTLLELTHAHSIAISTEHTLLDNNPEIVISAGNILTADGIRNPSE